MDNVTTRSGDEVPDELMNADVPKAFYGVICEILERHNGSGQTLNQIGAAIALGIDGVRGVIVLDRHPSGFASSEPHASAVAIPKALPAQTPATTPPSSPWPQTQQTRTVRAVLASALSRNTDTTRPSQQ